MVWQYMRAVPESAALIDRPDARCSDLDQMPVWIAKVDTLATQFPRAFLFHHDSVFREPIFPDRQLLGWDRKREMKFAIAIVRRLGSNRATFMNNSNTRWTPAPMAQPRSPKSLIIRNPKIFS